jgi:hypothetical protein
LEHLRFSIRAHLRPSNTFEAGSRLYSMSSSLLYINIAYAEISMNRICKPIKECNVVAEIMTKIGNRSSVRYSLMVHEREIDERKLSTTSLRSSILARVWKSCTQPNITNNPQNVSNVKVVEGFLLFGLPSTKYDLIRASTVRPLSSILAGHFKHLDWARHPRPQMSHFSR